MSWRALIYLHQVAVRRTGKERLVRMFDTLAAATRLCMSRWSSASLRGRTWSPRLYRRSSAGMRPP